MSSGPQVCGSAIGDRCEVISTEPERSSIPVCLLEVVADDFLSLGQMVSKRFPEPRGEPNVQLGSWRQELVGKVADQDVAKPVGVIPGQRRTRGNDQILSDRL
jgi:hypothetical protein